MIFSNSTISDRDHAEKEHRSYRGYGRGFVQLFLATQPPKYLRSFLNKGFLFGFIGVSVVASPCVHPYKHPVFTQHHTQTRFK